jgi:hypothetical protein
MKSALHVLSWKVAGGNFDSARKKEEGERQSYSALFSLFLGFVESLVLPRVLISMNPVFIWLGWRPHGKYFQEPKPPTPDVTNSTRGFG